MSTLAANGCGGGNDDLGERTPTAESTVVAGDADKDCAFRGSLSEYKRTDLASLCKNRAASDADERVGATAYGLIADVDDAGLASATTSAFEQNEQNEQPGTWLGIRVHVPRRRSDRRDCRRRQMAGSALPHARAR